MKRIIPFSRYFLPAAIFSIALTAFGVVGYFAKGFNLGVDFQAGLLQEIQFAPTAFRLTYNGQGKAIVSFSRNSLDIIISGAGVEGVTHSFPFASYPTQAELVRGLRGVDGLGVAEVAPSDTQSSWLVQSAQGNPQLGDEPFLLHYLTPDAAPVPIEDVRASLVSLGTVSVNVVGTPSERRFMIRMEDSEFEKSDASNPANKIITALQGSFGQGDVAVTSSNYVGSRFSKQLASQAGLLTVLTLLLILAYAAIRFKIQYAIGAVLSIAHDALIMVTFVVWTRMEFNTSTIAAILTILGYSINDTIVIFDRIKETRQMYPDDTSVAVMNRAITETMSRTIITTLTTMLAVVSLYVFTKGDMKDFALCLLVGMVSGVYSTIYIATGFVHFWEYIASKGKKKKFVAAPAKA